LQLENTLADENGGKDVILMENLPDDDVGTHRITSAVGSASREANPSAIVAKAS
jgi:hypothetical protein